MPDATPHPEEFAPLHVAPIGASGRSERPDCSLLLGLEVEHAAASSSVPSRRTQPRHPCTWSAHHGALSCISQARSA